MKVTSIELHPAGSSFVAVLSFRDPMRQNPYNVRQVSGLDADNIVSQYYANPPYGLYGTPDANFHTMALINRQIVMDIELNPNFSDGKTYSDLRDDLYRMISSSRTGMLQMQFKNDDDVIAAISGHVSKFEANLFDKIPKVQITLSTIDPTLRALEPVTLVGVGIIKVDVDEGGGVHHLDVTITDDLSTAPHGLMFQFTVDGPPGTPLPEATVEIEGDDNGIEWSFSATPSDDLRDGDVVHFSSERNAKELYYFRPTEGNFPFADGIASGSIWPVLFPGENQLRFNSSQFFTLDSISYYPTYWGI